MNNKLKREINFEITYDFISRKITKITNEVYIDYWDKEINNEKLENWTLISVKDIKLKNVIESWQGFGYNYNYYMLDTKNRLRIFIYDDAKKDFENAEPLSQEQFKEFVKCKAISEKEVIIIGIAIFGFL